MFVIWLFTQSVFSLGTLCPWCMVVWAVTIPLWWVSAFRPTAAGDIPASERTRQLFQQLASWSWVMILVTVLVIAFIAQLQLDWFAGDCPGVAPGGRALRPALLRDPRPQRVNLRERVGFAPRSINDHVRDRPPLLRACLLCNPTPGVRLGHSAQFNHSCYALLLRRVCDHNSVELPRAARLGEQRNLVHNDAPLVRGLGIGDRSGEQPSNLGVHNRVEILQRCGILEHDCSQRRPVKFPRHSQHPIRAESVGHPRKPRSARRNRVTRELIRVDARGPELSKPAPDRRFAGGNSAGQCNYRHGVSVASESHPATRGETCSNSSPARRSPLLRG